MEEREGGPRWDLIAIGLALVASAAYVVFVSMPKWEQDEYDARPDRARIWMDEIANAIDMYRLVNKRVPDSLDDLREPAENGEWFLKAIPLDPWGSPYEYRPDGRSRFDLRSAGPDGQLDTDDDIVHGER